MTPPWYNGRLQWAEKRILWVVEWPVDPRHSAVLAYNGSRVARVTRVYVVLEEPLIATPDRPEPGYLSRAAKWFWALSGVASGIATCTARTPATSRPTQAPGAQRRPSAVTG
ncbi:hypothetical protein Pyrfu_0492 [Pyrolobus fumarii 1A]|uniref:Uncharacterized protein n=1 Tax=Pyrolobus fumarii (strain DSM 11204 / 1A) TaxID=694429 RepID=G0EGI9_PYRF1|nr:hypothetical protein [Pyrolobus fumarii]AEM38363.1 hypothetical protein Pyrfu_0492 [Pyrolobus fumarii 1A]